MLSGFAGTAGAAVDVNFGSSGPYVDDLLQHEGSTAPRREPADCRGGRDDRCIRRGVGGWPVKYRIRPRPRRPPLPYWVNKPFRRRSHHVFAEPDNRHMSRLHVHSAVEYT